MKKYLGIMGLLILFPLGAFALSTFKIFQGGTNNTAYPNNIIVTSNSDGSQLTATSSNPLYVSAITATSTSVTSNFLGNASVTGTLTTGTLNTGFLTISNSITSNLTVNGGTISLGAPPNTATTTIIANGSGQLTLTAAGTNQNIVLTPSGTGIVSLGTPLTTPNGGTGVATLASNGVLYGNGTGNVLVTAQGAANTILTANAGAPAWSATPTINTSLTVPTIIGGTAVGSSLNLQSTSGVGTTDFIRFLTGNNGGTEAMRIIDSGNVGIGTTSPVSKLSVVGESAFAGGASVGIGYAGTAAPTGGMIIQGNVGIGTTGSGEPLTVYKNGVDEITADPRLVLRLSATDGSKGGFIGYSNSEQMMTLMTNGASSGINFWTHNGSAWGERMRISTTGNVGIGTTSPYALLSVQSGASTGNAFVVATSTGGQIGGYDNDGHRFSSGPAPAISSCGTGSPSVVGDDNGGTITTGTAATACTLTFSKAYRKTPYCTETDNSATIPGSISTLNTTTMTLSLGAGLTGGIIYYQCSYSQ